MSTLKRIKEIEIRLRSLKHEQSALQSELTEIKDRCRHTHDGATLSMGCFGFCSICDAWQGSK